MVPVPPATEFPESDEVNVGKYKLIASLGHGGMADVYLAVVAGPAGVNKLQVVKRLRREYAEDREHAQMFLDEARLAARLNHPNVVQTFEVCEEEGEYFMAMEYLEGAPLNRLLHRARTNPPPSGVLLKILTDVLAGLHYAHELRDYDGKPLNIVHRDASPHNVIVSFDGHTKLLDFGIAKSDVRTQETRAGIMKGKVGYMAPEQARCRPIDRRADVFVSGLVLWEMLAARKIWDQAPDMAVLHKLATGAIPKIETVRPDVPSQLAAICGKALSAEPSDRYATAAEMRAAILGYLDEAGIRVTQEEIGKYVTELFADKRDSIRKVIERQISRLNGVDVSGPAEEEGPTSMRLLRVGSSGPSSVRGASGLKLPSLRSMPPPSLSGASIPPVPIVPLRTRSETSQTQTQTQTDTETSLSGTPPSANPDALRGMGGQDASLESGTERGRGRVFVGLMVFLAAALGAFVLLRTQLPIAHAPSPAAATPTAAPTQAAPAVPMMQLTVRATPETAVIYLDEARLPSNPFTGKFPADGMGHRVRADAAGYVGSAQIVVFEKEATVEIKLEPKVGDGVRPR